MNLLSVPAAMATSTSSGSGTFRFPTQPSIGTWWYAACIVPTAPATAVFQLLVAGAAKVTWYGSQPSSAVVVPPGASVSVVASGLAVSTSYTALLTGGWTTGTPQGAPPLPQGIPPSAYLGSDALGSGKVKTTAVAQTGTATVVLLDGGAWQIWNWGITTGPATPVGIIWLTATVTGLGTPRLDSILLKYSSASNRIAGLRVPNLKVTGDHSTGTKTVFLLYSDLT